MSEKARGCARRGRTRQSQRPCRSLWMQACDCRTNNVREADLLPTAATPTESVGVGGCAPLRCQFGDQWRTRPGNTRPRDQVPHEPTRLEHLTGVLSEGRRSRNDADNDQSSAQSMTALTTTRLDDATTSLAGHAMTEPMAAGPTTGIWLISTLHFDLRDG